jgi:hypothetical protein
VRGLHFIFFLLIGDRFAKANNHSERMNEFGLLLLPIRNNEALASIYGMWYFIMT